MPRIFGFHSCGIGTLFIVRLITVLQRCLLFGLPLRVVSGEDCVCTFLRVDVYVIRCGPVIVTQEVYSADTLSIHRNIICYNAAMYGIGTFRTKRKHCW
jgi:hypothetical protein